MDEPARTELVERMAIAIYARFHSLGQIAGAAEWPEASRQRKANCTALAEAALSAILPVLGEVTDEMVETFDAEAERWVDGSRCVGDRDPIYFVYRMGDDKAVEMSRHASRKERDRELNRNRIRAALAAAIRARAAAMGRDEKKPAP
jgi:hypothetical protein